MTQEESDIANSLLQHGRSVGLVKWEQVCIYVSVLPLLNKVKECAAKNKGHGQKLHIYAFPFYVSAAAKEYIASFLGPEA